MSEFLGLSKNMLWQKGRLMTIVVLIDLIVLVVTAVMSLIGSGKTYLEAQFVGSLLIVNTVSFILLSRSNERLLTSNNYRLVPASDTKLYFSNILTTFVAFIYLQLIEAVVGIVMHLIRNTKIDDVSYTTGSMDFAWLAEFILLMILGMILVWTGITFIHLVINFISGFLPFGRQKFFLFILTVVVIWAAMSLFSFATGNIFSAVSGDGHGVAFDLNRMKTIGLLTIGIFAAWDVVLSGINIYLLKRWTETVR